MTASPPDRVLRLAELLSTGADIRPGDVIPCGWRNDPARQRQVRDYITVQLDELSDARQLAEAME